MIPSRTGTLMNPEYPVYIPSKGRSENGGTFRSLDLMGVSYRVIVEESEVDAYSARVGSDKVLVLPKAYQEVYEACDEHGMSRSKGSGPARNFAWDHAISLGAKRHWVIDDNISSFHRLNRNRKPRFQTGTFFYMMEHFVDRYSNIGLAGPNYMKFAKATDGVPAFVTNTRIYSCILIKTDLPFRWRGRYNEDTDLSLRVLKSGLVTVQFNAFLAEKVTTQRMVGGNTTELYADGTTDKSRMIERLHPDCAKVSMKFSRVHHHVDYSRFTQKLERLPGYNFSGVNEFGLKLARFDTSGKMV